MSKTKSPTVASKAPGVSKRSETEPLLPSLADRLNLEEGYTEDRPLDTGRSGGSETFNAFLTKYSPQRAPDYWLGLPRVHLRAAFIGIVLILLGILGFHLVEGWTYLSCAYVIIQIVTTIGFGDIVVRGGWGKVYVSIYACLIMILGGYYLSLFAERVNEGSAKKAKDRLSSLAKKVRTVKRVTATTTGKAGIDSSGFSLDWSHETFRLIMAFVYFAACVAFGTIFYRLYEHCTCSYGYSRVEGCREPDFETCKATGGYVIEWIESFYMSIMTLLTIGFGDHSPKSYVGRFVSLFWMVIGVSCTANFVAAVSEWLFSVKEKKDFSNAAKLIDERCNEFCTTKSSEMSRAEFLGFMLVQHSLVPADIIEQLNELFDDVERLDGAPDGTIDVLGLRRFMRSASVANLA